MATIEVTDASFEDRVIRNELPVLLDLYAEWCGPCKQMAPILEEIATELSGKLQVAKVDVEKNPIVAQTFRVQSIPMLVLFAQGQLAGHHVGALDKAGILKLVEPVLPAEASEVKPEELAQLLASRRAIPVDLRDETSFSRFRIPTAVLVSPADLEARPQEVLPKDGRIPVLYTRTSDDARATAETLREKGVEVGFLAGGFLHWEADGFEVEAG